MVHFVNSQQKNEVKPKNILLSAPIISKTGPGDSRQQNKSNNNDINNLTICNKAPEGYQEYKKENRGRNQEYKKKTEEEIKKKKTTRRSQDKRESSQKMTKRNQTTSQTELEKALICNVHTQYLYWKPQSYLPEIYKKQCKEDHCHRRYLLTKFNKYNSIEERLVQNDWGQMNQIPGRYLKQEKGIMGNFHLSQNGQNRDSHLSSETDQIKEKCRRESLSKVPAAPRRHAVAAFQLESPGMIAL
ncbi:hypothetical protein CEXT_761791 [Caerostris extrusa]|uniref:Uncharacterized protein n=1 Tax=Caerostris extrusa TaxID=172846 RepID=A0AAV4SV12_CAEEX|nr:hypothetical protein CEXT_761791 [Caerostris extrusa]